MSGSSFGYARVSTDDQNLALQIDALSKHGIPDSRIFKDKLSARGVTAPDSPSVSVGCRTVIRSWCGGSIDSAGQCSI